MNTTERILTERQAEIDALLRKKKPLTESEQETLRGEVDTYMLGPPIPTSRQQVKKSTQNTSTHGAG